MKKFIFIIILNSALFAQANAPRSSVSSATGGAGAASVEAGEASFMNPASLPHLKGRFFFSSLQKDLFALSLTENDRQSAVPGAFSYFADKELQMFSLSLADFVFQNISVGFSATYWQAEFDPQKKRDTAFNGNGGILWTPFKGFGVAFAAENMFTRPDEFKAQNQLSPNSRFGFNYLYEEWFRWRLDFVTLTNNRWNNWIPQTGIESYMNRWFILRAGVSRPPRLKESWSAGLGFDLPRFRLDYSSQWHVDGGKDQRHSVDLSIPF
jgi:hypothetical protein